MDQEELEKPAVEAPVAESVIGLDNERVREVVKALDEDKSERTKELVADLHAADMADLLEQISTGEREKLINFLGPDLKPETLTELGETVRDQVVELLQPKQLAAAVSELDTDDAVYLLQDLDKADRDKVLTEIPAEERQALREALAYPEDSAGRLMQQDLVAVPEFWTVGQTIDYMRETDDLPDDFYEVIVVDPAHHPVGTIALNRAMRAKREVVVSDIMDKAPILIPVDMDQEEVAYMFRQYRLVSAPVVDAGGRLIGVIMGDDVVEVVQDEAEEDIMYLSGVAESDIHESIVTTTKTRFTWLLVNLGTAVLASAVIAQFGGAIQRLVALATLMPIVASMGGNAATQTVAVAVRALATRELTPANALRIINKETLVAVANGIALAIIMGALAGLWFHSMLLGGILGAAMVINMFAAGLAGILIPLALQKLKIDPAVSSTVFVTTVTDVVGFLSFLGLASLILF
jgi:magnesium transporter